ncbi:MAG TPA: hypothetical protein PLN33_13240, partial [Hyphomonadaceae bacterium]|nr:hypothetical protein [Hyphomonadaceae bacterium]
MNAILLGAASLGAFIAIFTGNPSAQAEAKAELAKAERVLIEDRGEMKQMTIADSEGIWLTLRD